MLYIQRTLMLFAIVFTTYAGNAQAKEAYKILMFGDSITAGYGLEAKEAPPAQLEALLQQEGYDVVVINAGVSGDTTSAGRSRLKWTLDKYNPDAVILALGGNDMLRGINPSITRENINAMLTLITSTKRSVILSSVQAPSNLGVAYKGQLEKTYTDLATEYDVTLYPFLIQNTFGKTELMQRDGIHPNAKGAAQIANELAEFLSDELEMGSKSLKGAS